MWISYSVTPKWFLSNNGGGESNQQMNEKLNIITSTTATWSSFNNGTVECNNLIVAIAKMRNMSQK